MKRSLACLICALTTAAFAADQNPVLNGGFENVDANGKVENWDGKDFLSTEQPFEGKNCAKLAKTAGMSYHSISSNTFDVTTGTEYTITVQHRGDAAYIYAQFYDANGKSIGAPNRWVGNAKEWKAETYNVKAPEKAVKCSVLLRTFSEKPNFFDKLEVSTGAGK